MRGAMVLVNAAAACVTRCAMRGVWRGPVVAKSIRARTGAMACAGASWAQVDPQALFDLWTPNVERLRASPKAGASVQLEAQPHGRRTSLEDIGTVQAGVADHAVTDGWKDACDAAFLSGAEWASLWKSEAGNQDEGSKPFGQGHANAPNDGVYDTTAKKVYGFDGWLKCADPGTPGGLHVAGSGILWDKDAVAKAPVLRSSVRGVTAHAGCGAVNIFMAAQGHKTISTSEETGESGAADPNATCGSAFSRNVAASADLPFRFIRHLARPPGYLHARCIYYDVSNRFSYVRSPLLPPGFTLSRGIVSAPVAAASVAGLVQLAFTAAVPPKQNPFATRLSATTPFVLVPVGPADALAGLKTEIDKLVADDPSLAALVDAGRLCVASEGLTAPPFAAPHDDDMPHPSHLPVWI